MRWWRPIVIACAAVAALAPLPPPLVERWYSTGLYPPVQRAITTVSNAVPFALLDALIILTIVWLLVALLLDIRARRRLGWLPVAARTPFRILTAAAALVLVFLACWGLNYRRVPLRDKLAFDAGKVSPGRARDLALTAVDRVNALYAPAHAAPAAAFGPQPLEAAFAEAERELRVTSRATPARPKTTLLDWYFRRAGVDGMTDPFFLETLVVSGLLPFERPFIVAHEWSHLAGFADESEANFTGWLACAHGTEAEQYSGWLYLYSELAGAIRRSDAIQAGARLGEGPRADLRAVSARIAGQRNVTVSNAGWRVYDGYLKANRVEAGTASYAQVVRLVLGATFDANWVPVLRE